MAGSKGQGNSEVHLQTQGCLLQEGSALSCDLLRRLPAVSRDYFCLAGGTGTKALSYMALAAAIVVFIGTLKCIQSFYVFII